MSNQLKNSKLKMVITISLIAVCFYMIYRNCILTSDDYRYMFSRYDGTLVCSFKEAWASFVAEYLNWSGRLAHLWDILLLFSRGDIWRICTPILLGAMPFLLFYFFYLRIPSSLSDYLKIVIVLGLMTTFSDLYTVQMLYWHTACVTYFYMPMVMLAFLIPFRRILNNEEVQLNRVITFALIFVAFALGMSQEVVGAITVAFIFFTILYQLYFHKKVRGFEIVLFLSALSGFCFLIFAPGNAIRQAMPTFQWWNEAGIIDKIRHGLGQFIYNQYHVPSWIMIFNLVLLAHQGKTQSKVIDAVNYGCCVFISIFILAFTYGDSWMNWNTQEMWKYTQGYFYLSNKEVFVPILVYFLFSLYYIALSIITSYKRKDVMPFLIICAVYCSNLTVLFSSVGTSYISFPAVMLTLGLIMYNFPDIKKSFACTCIIALSLSLFLSYIYKEAKKMKTVAYEEQNRIIEIESSISNQLDSISIKAYSQRVWEGNIISQEYRKYYGIPEDMEVTIIEN